MNIVRLDEIQEKEIHKITELLRKGNLIIGPTDTVYGIFGNARSEKAILSLYLLKKRSKTKPFPIFVRDIAMARSYAYINDAKASVLERVWPGPITFLFHHKEKLPKTLTAASDAIGIRIPRHDFLSRLLARVDFPLVQTSANMSGHPSAQTPDDIKKHFQNRAGDVSLFVDGGGILGESSAVFDFTREKPVVVKTGLMPLHALDKILGQFYS